MIFFNCFCEISYFREIFDLSHFYSLNDKLYHPNHYSPGNRPKLAFAGGYKKNQRHFTTPLVHSPIKESTKEYGKIRTKFPNVARIG
jgi:hypothetical protein